MVVFTDTRVSWNGNDAGSTESNNGRQIVGVGKEGTVLLMDDGGVSVCLSVCASGSIFLWFALKRWRAVEVHSRGVRKQQQQEVRGVFCVVPGVCCVFLCNFVNWKHFLNPVLGIIVPGNTQRLQETFSALACRFCAQTLGYSL